MQLQHWNTLMHPKVYLKTVKTMKQKQKAVCFVSFEVYAE